MKAMILAAGKGTRVWPVTKSIPKPMIPVLRKPIMESLIEHFVQFGVKEYVVNTSYLAPVIQNYFRDGHQYGAEISYSYEGKMQNGELTGQALGSAGGMRKIQDHSGFFDETFVVVCGDAWIDLDLDKALAFHREKGGISTIILQEVDWEEVHKYGVVECSDDEKILRFQEKPKREDAVSNLINTGIYIFEPEIFDYIPPGKQFDIGGELFPLLAEKNVPFYGANIPFQWVDIGSLTDIWKATREILTGKVKGFKIPGKEVRPGIWCGINTNIDFEKINISGPVCIGSGTTIEDGATIKGPALIGSNCVIKSGCCLDECLLDDYTWVSSMSSIRERIIFGGYCITQSGDFVDLEDLDIGWAVNDSRCKVEDIEFDEVLLNTFKEVSLNKQHQRAS